MKITDIKTFLMMAGSPDSKESSSWSARNWCFVKVYTDEGIIGLGEGSGWPRVVETAINDLKPIVIGEDPMNIERIWQKMLVSTMGAGMTGTPGSGSMNAIDMALWDIKGKALNTPVWNLLGGKVRDRIRAYGHASTPERALELKERGLTAVKTGGVHRTVEKVDGIRKAVGDEVTILVDCHSRFEEFTAHLVAEQLEKLSIGWFEEPLGPNSESEELKRVSPLIAMSVAGGESGYGEAFFTSLLNHGALDIIMPDLKYCGGAAEAVAAGQSAVALGKGFSIHSPSGPISLLSSGHVTAAVDGAMFLEHAIDEVDWRPEIIQPAEQVENGQLLINRTPGLGSRLNLDLVSSKGDHLII